MITIYCALYPEAQELIHSFQMKKEMGRCHFQVFSNEEKGIRLVLTGVGAVCAAVSVAEISTTYPPEETDFLVNFGSCGAGSSFPQNKIFLCNKITEAAGGRTFYPDILYRHSFTEAEITSFSRPQECTQIPAESLCDMEAAAVYQAGIYYYGPHQMVFLKVVSDHGFSDRFNKQEFSKTMKTSAKTVAEYLDQLCKITHQTKCVNQTLSLYAEKLKEELSCSVTMQAELDQMLRYFELAGKDYKPVIEEYRQSGRLPCDRREGKKILEEFKSGLL